jgi:hypothetical protein
MKKMFLGTCLFFALTQLASAAVDESGLVANIIVEANYASIWLNGADPTTECVGAGGRWTINNTDVTFKEKLAMLMAAATAGKTVSLRSTGTCGNWGSNIIYYVNVAINS